MTTTFKDLNYRSLNNFKEVKELLASGEDPSEFDNFAIVNASEKGQFQTVKLLLSDKRVDPSAQHNHSIRTAVENGYTGIAELLLKDSRVDVNTDNGFCLRETIALGSVEMLKILLRCDDLIIDEEFVKVAIDGKREDIIMLVLADKRIDLSRLPNSIKENQTFIDVVRKLKVTKLGKFKDFLNL